MRLISRSLVIGASVAMLAAPAFAGQAKTAEKAVSAKSAKPAKVTVISTTGTLSKFDAATNVLTVTTAKGDSTFTLDSSASVLANGKRIMNSDIASNAGKKVTVRYTESGGQKTAESLRITAATPKTASAKKTSTKKQS